MFEYSAKCFLLVLVLFLVLGSSGVFEDENEDEEEDEDENEEENESNGWILQTGCQKSSGR